MEQTYLIILWQMLLDAMISDADQILNVGEFASYVSADSQNIQLYSMGLLLLSKILGTKAPLI